ncbi:hypothetical protein JOQ06_008032, partial [Pogonophryne albipinna]
MLIKGVFARSHKTFLVRADEALLPTVGTPGKMGRSVGLLRPWCDTACPIRYTNTGTRLFPCSRTASICTHHYNEGPSVKAAALLISGILSGKIVASGQQQKQDIGTQVITCVPPPTLDLHSPPHSQCFLA